MKRRELYQKLIYLLAIFTVGAIVGYLYEVIFYYFTEHIISNRGVLYGPWLPIYGAGAVLIYFLKPLKKHPIILFISMMLVTGILEYVVGLYCLKVSNVKLWDYTGLFLNIQGLVCLRSVISFAIGGLILIYLIEPYLDKKINKISIHKLSIASFIFISIFLTDILLSTIYRTPITYWKK